MVVSLKAVNWLGFRGANAGVAEKEKAVTSFGRSSNALWSVEIPRGHSSPVVWKERVFLTGVTGNQLTALCLDRQSGKRLWEQSITVEKPEKVHKANSLATSTPVTDGSAVYVYFGSFGLLAYDLDGKELWRKPLPMPKTFFNQGTGTSPVLADGKEAWWVSGLGFQACSTPVVVGDRMVISSAGAQGELSNMRPPPSFDEIIKSHDRNSDGLIAFEEIPDNLLFTIASG